MLEVGSTLKAGTDRTTYEWLIRGLLQGARRLVGDPDRVGLVHEALAVADKLLVDMLALVADQSEEDWLARALERQILAELSQGASGSRLAGTSSLRRDGHEDGDGRSAHASRPLSSSAANQ